MIRWHVISGVFWRNVKQYFTSVLGYLFIVVFVGICAILTFSPQFFADNLANLDQLNRFFPVILLIFIPAITMSAWSEEKRQGTDAILFTLPASDLEIMLGKYFSVVAVYTIALLFSLTQVIALQMIGTPDWGVIFTTYLGYWLAGIALIAVGMFASSLTESATVAFVLAAVLCAIPVLIGLWNVVHWIPSGLIMILGESSPQWLVSTQSFLQENASLESLSIGWQLVDFTEGLISIPGIIYFLSLTVFMLYMNLIVISKRHWSRGQQTTLAGHFAVRVFALALALISVNVIADRSSSMFNNRVDLTAERIYTLDQTTRETIADAAANNRPVTLQAFISKTVPRQYANTKKQLVGLLRQYNRIGGNHVDVRIVEVTPFSAQSQEAQSLGIRPQKIRDTIAGKFVEQDVYMGVVVTSTLDEVVLPVIDRDSSIEYQLTRSIANTTDQSLDITVGILKTDAHFDNLNVGDEVYPWSFSRTLDELKLHYEVDSVSSSDFTEIVGHVTGGEENDSTDEAEVKDAPDIPDVLLVADPSSLSSLDMANLVRYVKTGRATLILADPLPFYWNWRAPTVLGVINAPSQERISPQSQWAPVASSSQPKADRGTAKSLTDALGIVWPHDQAVWHLFDPHAGFSPEISDVNATGGWPEYYGPKENLFLFLRDYADHKAFNPASEISRGLKEVLFMYPGRIFADPKADIEFIPLIATRGGDGGHLLWEEVTQEIVRQQQRFDRQTGQIISEVGPITNFFTGQPFRAVRPQPVLASAPESNDDTDDKTPTVSATSDDSGDDQADEGLVDETKRNRLKAMLDTQANVVAAHIRGKGVDQLNVVFIADTDFVSDMFYEQQKALGEPLDNPTLLANAIEVLQDNTTYVRLRNRRLKPRTLTRIEKTITQYRRQRARKQEESETALQASLADAQLELDNMAQQLEADTEMDSWQKDRQGQILAQTAQRKFDLEKEKLEEQLQKDIDAYRGEEQQNIKQLETQYRYLSIILAVTPALLLGLVVLVVRTRNEQKHIVSSRRV